MSIDPVILDKVYQDYVQSNPESLQSPNLAAICRQHDVDYESVRNQANNNNWLSRRIEFQTLYRHKKIEGITASLEVHGINIGEEIASIIQKGITINSKYEELIDKRVFEILEDEDKKLTINELAKLKTIVSGRWDSLIKVLMDTVKLANESNKNSGTDVSDELKALVKLLRMDAIDTTISHKIDQRISDKEPDSFDTVSQSERDSFFKELDDRREGNES